MSKHTPGPWRWATNTDGDWQLLTNGPVAIARNFDTTNPADARLIAAAPDLLTIAKQYAALAEAERDKIEETLPTERERRVWWHRRYQEAMHAISKATGETQ